MAATPGNLSDLPRVERPTIVAPPKEFFRQFSNLHHNRVLNEDFPHEKLLTIKYKGTAPNFVVDAKGSVTFKQQAIKGEVDKFEEVPTTSGEVKFLTYWQGKTIQARFNNKGITRFWANLGNYNVGQPLEFITVLKTDNVFKRLKAYVTAGYHGPNIDAVTRFQIRHQDTPKFSLAEKVTLHQGNFWAGVYGDLDFATAQITQYNALVGYNVNKNFHVYAEHQTVAPRDKETVAGYRLGKLSFAGVYKDPRYWGLGQVIYDATTDKVNFTGGVVYTVDANTSLRAKITQTADLTFGARYRVNRNLSINLGTFATLKTPEKIVDKTKTVPIPFGVQVEFSF